MNIRVYKHPDYETNFFTLKPNRDWMDDSVDKQAYRCLPVTLANCLGWSFSLPEDISFILHSSTNTVEILSGIKYSSTDRTNETISFISGLTIQTDMPTSLLLMPVPNQFIDGVSPFTSIINTSVLKAPISFAWKITRHDEIITIKAGTPIVAMIPLALKPLQDVSFQVMDDPLDNKYFEYIDDYRKSFTDMIYGGKYTNMYRDAIDHLGNPRGEHELKTLRLNLDML